jgi:hypothetical protein
MKKYTLMLAAAAVSLGTVAAEAGGWGNNKSKPLVNVSPSVDVGNIVVGGNDILNGNAILSGNVVSGILNGNNTGILNGIGVGILSGNKSYSLKK